MQSQLSLAAFFTATILSFVLVARNAQAIEIWASDLNGNATDATGGGNNGVATGTPTATDDRNGVAGGATLFDGTSYFTIPNTGNAGSLGTTLSQASIALWVRIDNVNGETGPIGLGSSGGGDTQYFGLLNTLEFNDADQNSFGWGSDVDGGAVGGNIARIRVNSNGTGVDGGGYSPMGSGGIWQHLAVTFAAGGELRMYVNGVLQTSEIGDLSGASAITPTNAWVIGSERAGSRNIVGAIDDVHIFNHQLSQGEIDGLAHLIPGDVNNDGMATIDDFNLIRDNFGDSVLLRRLGDLNQDRVVDFADFNEWKNAVPPSVAALASFASVPEPGSVVLVIVGSAGLLALRGRQVSCTRSHVR